MYSKKENKENTKVPKNLVPYLKSRVKIKAATKNNGNVIQGEINKYENLLGSKKYNINQ